MEKPRTLNLLFRLIHKCFRVMTGMQIHPRTKIGGGLLLPHYGTIVIHDRSTIGEDCIILHHVTLGAKGGGFRSGVPKIGNRCYLGSGSCILGDVEIGEGAVIGAGSVVLSDVPPFSVVAGNPARIIRRLKETTMAA